jgi:hypothetical protein
MAQAFKDLSAVQPADRAWERIGYRVWDESGKADDPTLLVRTGHSFHRSCFQEFIAAIEQFSRGE